MKRASDRRRHNFGRAFGRHHHLSELSSSLDVRMTRELRRWRVAV